MWRGWYSAVAGLVGALGVMESGGCTLTCGGDGDGNGCGSGGGCVWAFATADVLVANSVDALEWSVLVDVVSVGLLVVAVVVSMCVCSSVSVEAVQLLGLLILWCGRLRTYVFKLWR